MGNSRISVFSWEVPNEVGQGLPKPYELLAIFDGHDPSSYRKFTKTVGKVLVEEVEDPSESGCHYLQISEFEYTPLSSNASRPCRRDVAAALLEAVEAKAAEKGNGIQVYANVPVPVTFDEVISLCELTLQPFKELGFRIAAGMSNGARVECAPDLSWFQRLDLDAVILKRERDLVPTLPGI